MDILILAIIFFSIALIYSSVGFGGGSSYIAVLIASSVSIGDTRFVALICNIIVVAYGTFRFHQAGLLPMKKVLPLVILSIPLAFLGGTIRPDEAIYKIIAAMALILASMVMLFSSKPTKNQSQETSKSVLTAIGGGIGLASGFIGIGGGIFLSPILHLMKWENAKIISAVASFFILVNSIAGLMGQTLSQPSIQYSLVLILGGSVFLGGLIGNRLNIHILPLDKVRLITAVLIGIVGINLLISQLS